MYIWMDEYGNLERVYELYEISGSTFLGKFEEDDPESFWKYMRIKESWYLKSELAMFMERLFKIAHPVRLCIVTRSIRSGKICVKLFNENKHEYHEVPHHFCYKKDAAMDVYKHYLPYHSSKKYNYPDPEFLAKIDNGKETYLLYKVDVDFGEEEPVDMRSEVWVCPEDIIAAPWQIEVVDYIKQAFSTHSLSAADSE